MSQLETQTLLYFHRTKKISNVFFSAWTQQDEKELGHQPNLNSLHQNYYEHKKKEVCEKGFFFSSAAELCPTSCQFASKYSFHSINLCLTATQVWFLL